MSGSRRSSRRRPSPAIVLAIVAVVLSLVGTAYAGVQLGRSSVGTFQLKDGSVTTAKLHNGAVTAAKANGCPSNTVEIGPGCVEAGLRQPAGYAAAVATCASIGGRLPFASELAGIAALGHPIGNPELVGDSLLAGRGRESQVVIYPGAVQTAEEAVNTPRRFRCVISPV
jgi:hypothetical protein